MKMTLFVALLLALGAGIFFTANKTTATNKNIIPVTTQASTVELVQFEVSEGISPELQKISFTLNNRSDQDVFFVDVLLSGEGNSKFGIGIYTKDGEALKAGGQANIVRMVKKGKLTPALRCVVFAGDSYEGDAAVATRVRAKRRGTTIVAKAYFNKLTALDKTENPLVDIAKLRKQVHSELLPLQDIEDLPAAKTEELPVRIQAIAQKAALLDLLTELETLEKAFAGSAKKQPGLGERSAQKLTRFI